jgi:hypothetical protein
MKKTGHLIVTGVGCAILDMDGIKIPLSGEVRVDGIVRQAVINVSIPNSLVGVLTRAIDHPVEQIPMFRPELIRLSINKS